MGAGQGADRCEPATVPRDGGTRYTAADGFTMPAEFDAHQATWMSWPTNRSLWDGHLDPARDEWAATARAVAAFEPVVMVCNAR